MVKNEDKKFHKDVNYDVLTDREKKIKASRELFTIFYLTRNKGLTDDDIHKWAVKLEFTGYEGCTPDAIVRSNIHRWNEMVIVAATDGKRCEFFHTSSEPCNKMLRWGYDSDKPLRCDKHKEEKMEMVIEERIVKKPKENNESKGKYYFHERFAERVFPKHDRSPCSETTRCSPARTSFDDALFPTIEGTLNPHDMFRNDNVEEKGQPISETSTAVSGNNRRPFASSMMSREQLRTVHHDMIDMPDETHHDMIDMLDETHHEHTASVGMHRSSGNYYKGMPQPSEMEDLNQLLQDISRDCMDNHITTNRVDVSNKRRHDRAPDLNSVNANAMRRMQMSQNAFDPYGFSGMRGYHQLMHPYHLASPYHAYNPWPYFVNPFNPMMFSPPVTSPLMMMSNPNWWMPNVHGMHGINNMHDVNNMHGVNNNMSPATQFSRRRNVNDMTPVLGSSPVDQIPRAYAMRQSQPRRRNPATMNERNEGNDNYDRTFSTMKKNFVANDRNDIDSMPVIERDPDEIIESDGSRTESMTNDDDKFFSRFLEDITDPLADVNVPFVGNPLFNPGGSFNGNEKSSMLEFEDMFVDGS